MICGHLFAGINGFGLASDQMGWETAFNCEIDKFCQIILKYYWPNAELYGDIKTTDFTIWENRIDLITGGFPCQGFSVAGRREGTNDNRYLWPEMRKVYNTIKPTWIIGENVTGILSMENKSGIWKEVFPKMESRKIVRFDEIDNYEAIYTRQAKMLISTICEDFEKDGYEVQPIIIPAASVGAPHKRDRIWFIAYSEYYRNSNRPERIQKESETKGMGQQHTVYKFEQSDNIRRTTPNSSGKRTRESSERYSKSRKLFQENEWGKNKQFNKSISTSGITPNSNSQGLQKRISTRFKSNDSQAKAHKRGEFTRRNTKKYWEKFPTQSPVCSRNDGLSSKLSGITFSKHRRESIKAYGNSIVPQIAYELFKAINEVENYYEKT